MKLLRYSQLPPLEIEEDKLISIKSAGVLLIVKYKDGQLFRGHTLVP